MKKQLKAVVFAVMVLSYISIYIARSNLSMAGAGMAALGIDEAKIGMLGSVFSVVYAVGRLVNGRISDTAAPWKMITFGLLISGTANLLLGLFPPFYAIAICWLFNAVGQSMLWSSILVVVSSLYEPKTAKKLNIILITAVAVGNILAIILNNLFIDKMGLRYAFVIPGIITAVMGVAAFFSTVGVKPKMPTSKRKPFFALFKNKELDLMLVPAFLHGVMKDSVILWMVMFVMELYGVDLSRASMFVWLVPAVGVFGRLAYGVAYKFCKENENTVSCLGFVLCVVASVVLSVGRTNILLSVICLCLIYAAASMINTSFLSIYPMRYVESGNLASVSGLMDFFSYLGFGVSSFVFGIVIKHFGYAPMFVSWAAVSALSVFIILYINRRQRKTA